VQAGPNEWGIALPDEELLAQTRRALAYRIAVGQAQGRTPSLLGAVVRGGRLVWTGGRSMIDGHAPDADVQYRIGSMTKTFVAAQVLRLRDSGALDLADPLERHLPGTAAGHLTVAQLLAHTSGLASESPGPWWERTPGALRPALGDVLGEAPTRYPAGRRFHYSNPGYALLGAMVGRLRGLAWGEALRADLLAPLGMARTTLDPQAPHAGGFAVHPWADVMLSEPAHDTGTMAPAGQLWSTAADLARWAVCLSGGAPEVLGAEALAEMRRPASEPEKTVGAGGWTAAYGLGLELRRQNGRELYGHTGSMPGYLATLWISERDDVAAVVFANATAGPAIGRIAADLIQIVAEREPRFPDPWRPLPDVDPALLELTGPWYWGPMAFVLRLRAGRGLELTSPDGSDLATRLRTEADGTWTALDGYLAGETARLVRGPGGSVSQLDVGTYVFTRAPYDPDAGIPGGVDPAGWRG
jgi:D-alanyl-D-alanine carboxypeptidase